MKQFLEFTGSTRKNVIIRTPVFLLLANASAVSLWFALAPRAVAAPPMMLCPVCHKHIATLMLPCGSAAIRRHLDHGDPAAACGATSSNTFLDPVKPASKQQQQQNQ